ncbi:MAG: winged helix-turn-helix domain-containing protein [Anaerolineae bacterium]
MKLLFLTSHADAVERLRPSLLDRGIEVVHSTDPEHGMRLFRREQVQLVLLDATGPGVDGEAICQMFRRSKHPPVLMVITNGPRSAYRSADFHLKPPVTARKLLYRIRKYLQGDEGGILRSGDLVLHVHERRLVRPDGGEVRLTPKLCHLLVYFIRNPGKDLSRKAIMKAVWDTEYVGDTRTLDVHIHWLRRKLEPDPKNPAHICTVRGLGYRFEPV